MNYLAITLWVAMALCADLCIKRGLSVAGALLYAACSVPAALSFRRADACYECRNKFANRAEWERHYREVHL